MPVKSIALPAFDIDEFSPKLKIEKVSDDSVLRTRFITGMSARIIVAMIWVQVFAFLLIYFRSALKAIGYLRLLAVKRLQIKSTTDIAKLSISRNRFFINMHIPGWPSKAFNRLVLQECLKADKAKKPAIRLLILAITKKCGFSCEHCFEWEALNKPDNLSSDDLLKIINRFYDLGISQVHLSGGEPLNRFNDLTYILRHAPRGIDYWINTSGYLLSVDKAIMLRKEGLTGVIISIDHFIPEKHNRFRGMKDSFQRAQEAIQAANFSGLAVGLNCCLTRELCTLGNLELYLKMAANAGVAFVQFLEPRAVGHYAGKDITLRQSEINTCEHFFELYAVNHMKNDWPVISYPAYYNRRFGCSGGGNEYLYVDTDGMVQSCPFCTAKRFSALDGELGSRITALKKSPCAVNDFIV
jgi:MoaA/NifB/PqqE/SkfB family radical SAM enzyme